MSGLFGNHIVGFPTRRLKYFCIEIVWIENISRRIKKSVKYMYHVTFSHYYNVSARSTESGPFRIDPDSGLITLARSLPETVPVYMLNITAYDDGSCCPGRTSLSSDTYILVEIRDTNNNQPQFPDCSYEPEVLENQPAGTKVVQVRLLTT